MMSYLIILVDPECMPYPITTCYGRTFPLPGRLGLWGSVNKAETRRIEFCQRYLLRNARMSARFLCGNQSICKP
jgi:hypothetical protein